MKSYIAEAIGTCLLTLVLIMGATLGPWIGAVMAAFVLMYVVYGFGHVSGAHINPAITLGALSVNKITPLRALYYIVSQLAGVSLAIGVLYYSKIAAPTAVESVWSWKLFLAEVMGMIIFSYGVAGVAFKKVESAASGFVVGLSLFLGLVASMLLLGNSGDSAVLNPAVAFGLSLTSWATVIGPIVGSVIGMWLFVTLGEDAKSIARDVKRNFKA